MKHNKVHFLMVIHLNGKNYTINTNKEYKYIRYAVSKVYGEYSNSGKSYFVLSELEMFGDVILEQAGVTNVIKGQALEKIAGIADGRKLEGRENTYTLDNVTQALYLMKMEQVIQNILVIQMEQTALIQLVLVQ